MILSRTVTTAAIAAAALAAGTFAGGRDALAGETAPARLRPAAFAACIACHTTTPGTNGFGPSLAGIATRGAASLPGYAYSDALKKSGLTWNAATFDRWLTSPQRLVPGTRMPFAGIANPAKRKEVVDYLLTLK